MASNDNDDFTSRPARREPVIGTKGPNASRPRGSTGGGLNDLSSARTDSGAGNRPRSAAGPLNPRTTETVPRARREQEERILGFKKGGVIPDSFKSNMGKQFGQGKGKSATKPEGKKSGPPVGAKPTKGGFGRGTGPVKQSSSSPLRKKFI